MRSLRLTPARLSVRFCGGDCEKRYQLRSSKSQAVKSSVSERKTKVLTGTNQKGAGSNHNGGSGNSPTSSTYFTLCHVLLLTNHCLSFIQDLLPAIEIRLTLTTATTTTTTAATAAVAAANTLTAVTSTTAAAATTATATTTTIKIVKS